MLQAIREKAQGWIAWAIVILISIPFALFGIQQYLGVDANPPVAKVNGDKITSQQLQQRVRDFRENMRRTLGKAFVAELFNDAALKPRVLQRMIDETLLRQAADDWNMRIGDAQVAAYIRSIPSLQNNGHFDPGLYEATVRNQGLSKAGFEELVRSDMLAQQQRGGITGSAIVTESELAEKVRLDEQKRSVDYLSIPAASFSKAGISEADARAYYQANQNQYRVPERVKLDYIHLRASDLLDQVEVTDDKLREYFDTHRDEFVATQERKVRHILIESNEKNDTEKKALAEKLLKQLREGADFAKLAKQYSNDPGSAEDGGDLGWVNRGVMVKPFEDAVFAAEPGKLVGPVKTRYGYHIILVDKVRGGEEQTFDQVRAKVEKRYRQAQAEELYYNYSERLADLAYETPDSLVPVAEALGLKIQHSDWVSRNRPPADLNSPKVLNAAFSDDVLAEGNNSDVIELGPTDSVVLRVAEHQEATVRPFEQVKAQVMQAAARARASDRARAEGEKWLAALRKGDTDLKQVAQQHGWELKHSEVSHKAADVPAELVDAVFSVPALRQQKPAYTGVVSAEGDYLLAAVTRITDGDISQFNQQQRKALQAAMRRQRGAADFRGLLKALRARADIEILLK
jgi:peptidyl-prolyl cis-trans isomerase D